MAKPLSVGWELHKVVLARARQKGERRAGPASGSEDPPDGVLLTSRSEDPPPRQDRVLHHQLVRGGAGLRDPIHSSLGSQIFSF